jgi:hypothetical protein
MQSSRWEMDPFAVASKSFFVNDRMAYEAQLVIAVINARAPLVGRLHYDYEGEGNGLICRVTGRLRGDDRDKTVVQDFASITVKNSPLWKQAPRQQLGYYTARLWARLHCPEVLLGVYAEDELRDGGTLRPGADGTYVPAAARPQRADFREAPQDVTIRDARDEAPEVGANQDEESEPAFEVWNHWGERTLATDDEQEFCDAMIELIEQAADERVLSTLCENNRFDMVASDAAAAAIRAALAAAHARTAKTTAPSARPDTLVADQSPDPTQIPVPVGIGNKPDWPTWRDLAVAAIEAAPDLEWLRAWNVMHGGALNNLKKASAALHGDVTEAIERSRAALSA